MDACEPYTESYFLRMSFYGACDPSINRPDGEKTWSLPVHTVTVRVTNTEKKCLTYHNLQSASLSLPDLFYRITGQPYSPELFCLACLQIHKLPDEYSVPPRQDPSSRTISTKGFILGHSSTPYSGQHDVDSRRGSHRDPASTASDWLVCDGSFVPPFPGKEWSPVTYRNEAYCRAVSRVAWIDDEADIVGRCNIADYTRYEQLVFSVDVDVLREDSMRMNFRHKGRKSKQTGCEGAQITQTQ